MAVVSVHDFRETTPDNTSDNENNENNNNNNNSSNSNSNSNSNKIINNNTKEHEQKKSACLTAGYCLLCTLCASGCCLWHRAARYRQQG